MDKVLKKSANDKMLFGVCGGLGEYFEIDSTIIRIVWAISILAFGFGLLPYLICAILMKPATY